MKKITLLFLVLSITVSGFAQSSKYMAQRYFQEGLKYHQWMASDRAYMFYEKAIKRACMFYEKAVKEDPKYAEAYYYWGNALARIAEEEKNENTYKESFEKFKKATKIDKKYYKAYNDWAYVIIQLGSLKGKLKPYASEAEALLKKAEKLGCQSAAYNFACLYSLTNNKKKALEWLNTLMSKAYTYKMDTINRMTFDKDKDFDNIRESDEFIQFLNTNFPDQIPDRFQAI